MFGGDFESGPSLQKAYELGELIKEETDLVKSSNGVAVPKSWFVDPYAFQDAVGLGYRTGPTGLGYETLRLMSEREPITAAILKLRVTQAQTFCKPQPNKYSVGFKFVHKDIKRKLSEDDKREVFRLQNLLLSCGRTFNRSRDSFSEFIGKFVRDSLTYDQACVETVRNHFGGIVSFNAVPSETFRIAKPKHKKGTPLRLREIKSSIKYAQIIQGKIEEEFTDDELIFAVRNPRSDLRVGGYGLSELELAFRTITALLWGVEWNIKSFSQGATAKGMLNFKGNIPTAQFEAFKRQWLIQTAGVSNAWKTPMINTEEVQWIPLQLSNTEMGYSQWLEFLIKVLCALYQVDPAELNFDLRGSAGQAPAFMTTNEAQQKMSKDRGLQPLLHFIEGKINRYIIWPENNAFDFMFVGLDAKTEEQAIELRLKQIQYKTVNEVRAEDELPPVKEGDIILNPVYTGYLLQKGMQQQQQAAQAAQGGGGQPGQPPAPEPQEAYEDKFKDAPFEKEEQHAGKHLENEAEEDRPEHPLTGKKKPSHNLGIEDWQSTVRAALDDLDMDLKKSDKPKKSKPQSKYFLIDE